MLLNTIDLIFGAFMIILVVVLLTLVYTSIVQIKDKVDFCEQNNATYIPKTDICVKNEYIIRRRSE